MTVRDPLEGYSDRPKVSVRESDSPMINVYLGAELAKRLRAEADRRGWSVSETTRAIVRMALDKVQP